MHCQQDKDLEIRLPVVVKFGFSVVGFAGNNSIRPDRNDRISHNPFHLTSDW